MECQGAIEAQQALGAQDFAQGLFSPSDLG